MKNSQKSNLSTLLDVDYSDKDGIWLKNGYSLRRIIGVLGMGLPLLLFLFLYNDSGLNHPLGSISHIIILELVVFLL